MHTHARTQARTAKAVVLVTLLPQHGGGAAMLVTFCHKDLTEATASQYLR